MINDYAPSYGNTVLQANLGRVMGLQAVFSHALPTGGTLHLFRVPRGQMIWVVLQGDQAVASGALDVSGKAVKSINAGVLLEQQGRGIYPAVLKAVAHEVGALHSPQILSAGAVKAWQRAGAVQVGGCYALEGA